MRGEESSCTITAYSGLELPPHARRRGHRGGVFAARDGITSACAEKSSPGMVSRLLNRNYLRMRGEEDETADNVIANLELPPHARRRGNAVYQQ